MSKEQSIGININQNYQQKDNHHLDYLIDPSFQGVNRLFDLSFENNDDRKTHRGYFRL